MKRQLSPLWLGILLLLCSGMIIGIMNGCDTEKKQIKPVIVGPAGGSGPTGGGETQKLILLASPSDTIPVVSGSEGVVTITALVENNIGQSMPDGTPVYWSTTAGTVDPTTTTSSNGSVTVTFRFPSYYTTGCSHVTAQSGDARANIKICSVIITPTPSPPTPTPGPTATATPSRTLTLSANPSLITLLADDSDIVACATTNGVPDVNLQVNFTTNSNPAGGGTLNQNNAVTDATGCTPILPAPGAIIFTPSTAPFTGTFTINATTPDGRSANVNIAINIP